ncbi:hypothetical protein HYV79_04135 [Candidatus Woesearchaeota archaeon]|nr:hypothetical protein [Candidatus Woesearchaeota archaeon]
MENVISVDEALDRAKKELGRADHLLFVSLKYTRTVDVIKSIIERLINAISCVNEALLIKIKQEGKIKSIPELPRLRVDSINEAFASDEVIPKFEEFYLILRKLDKSEYERALEFRRHVTMTAYVDGKKVEVTIDIVQDYFQKTKEFIKYVEIYLKGENED